jgi:hypothetical protein
MTSPLFYIGLFLGASIAWNVFGLLLIRRGTR